MTAPAHEDPLEECAWQVMQPGRVVTWLNHYSLLNADWEQLARVDLVGIDGTLLQMALARAGHSIERSSADLVAPHVFRLLDKGAKIALIGAEPGVALKAAERLGDFETMCIDGYEGLAQLRADPGQLIAFDPRLVIVGLGAGLQDRIAVGLRAWLPRASVMTAGGWIDQFAAAEQYFPAWIHRFRLGWAWRIAHEPRRLIGRYTVDALRFVVEGSALVARLESMGSPTPLGVRITSGSSGA